MKTTSPFYPLALAGLLVVLLTNAWQLQTHAAATQAAQAAAPLAAETCNTGRAIHVSGAAVINVTPDRALIQLGVQSNGETPQATQEANFRAIQKVIQAVRALAVEAKDIATDHYLVYPVYDDYNSLVITGYRIDNLVSITLRDIHLAEKVIVAALQAGANEVLDVQFYTSQLRAFRDQARELAMIAAGEKAQALAGAAGAQAGCVLSISENTWTQYYGSWRGGRQTALWAQNVIQNSSSGEMPQADDSPISLGQIAIRAEVSASFNLE